MAIEKIIDMILSEAREKARAIQEAGEAEVANIAARGRADADAEHARILDVARQQFESEKRRNLALSGLESRKKILQERCRLVDQAFAEALTALQKAGVEAHKKLIRSVLGDFKPQEPCEILLNRKDLDEYTVLLSTLWGVSFTKYCKVTPLDKQIGGGFLLRTEKIEYDCTWQRLVLEARSRLELKASRILFEEKDGGKSAEKS